MTIFTETPVRNSTLSEYQVPLGAFLGARAAAEFERGLPYIERAGELVKAEQGQPKGFLGIGGRYEPETSLLRPEDARQRVRDAGVDLTVPEEGIRGGALDILIRTKQDEKRRQDIEARAPDGMLAKALGVGASFAGAAADPLNIATAFFPILGEARYAALVARAGGVAGRAGVRAGVGVAEGVVGATVLEPFVYSAATQLQADYDLSDSLLNIGVGGVLGGGLHVGVGAASDAISKGLSWRQAKPVDALPLELGELDFPAREAVLRTAVRQTLESQPVDIEAVLAAQARRILAREAPTVAGERQPVSLSRFVAGIGGVQDFKGELSSLDLDKTFVPGAGRLVREGGRKLDMAREAAAEAGYLDHIYGDADTAVANSTVADFLDALASDVRGERVYSGQDFGRVNAQSEIAAARAGRDKLRQQLDQISQELETELPDEIVLDAARFMDDGLDAPDAIESAIIRDYNINGAKVPLERANGTQLPPGWESPNDGRGRLAQRQALAQRSGESRPGPESRPAEDSRASGDAGKDQGEPAEAGLKQALIDLGRVADALGAQERVSAELSTFDRLLETAASYGRAVQAAASCQLRRGK